MCHVPRETREGGGYHHGREDCLDDGGGGSDRCASMNTLHSMWLYGLILVLVFAIETSDGFTTLRLESAFDLVDSELAL